MLFLPLLLTAHVAQAFQGGSTLSPAEGLRVDGLDPKRFAQADNVGLVLAIDNSNPVLSWWVPPPPLKFRGAKIISSHVTMWQAEEKKAFRSWKIEGEDVDVRYQDDGYPLKPGSRYCFAVEYETSDGELAPRSEKACFEMGLGDGEKAWGPSAWIGSDDLKVLRTEFDVSRLLMQKASTARLYVSGSWGQYYINGERISVNESLGVGWTRYDKKCYYATYSVLPLLNSSRNALGVALGQGWRDFANFPPRFEPGDLRFEQAPNVTQVLPGRAEMKGLLSKPPKWTSRVVRMILKLRTNDGVWHTIAHTTGKKMKKKVGIEEQQATTSSTGPNATVWQGTLGPVVFDSLYDGETYDAREAQRITGCFSPHYSPTNSSLWGPVPNVGGETWAKRTTLVAQRTPPIRQQETVAPLSIRNKEDSLVGMSEDGKSGHFVIDFEKNRAGVCRVLLPKGERGSNITIRHAETTMHAPYGYFGEDGQFLYYDNLRSARATDSYIFSGALDEAGQFWQPAFTYHGFRHIEIFHWPCGNAGNGVDDDAKAFGLPTYALRCKNFPRVQMIHFRTDMDQHGDIRSSSPVVNSFWEMALGSLASNVMSVPTDCPQRDERLGWMGDAGSSADISALVLYRIVDLFLFTTIMSVAFDVAAFHDAFLELIEDDMSTNGSIPDVVPFYRYGNQPADPSWSSAYVFILYSRYHIAGDVRPYEEHRDGVKLYLENMHRQYERRGGFGEMEQSGVKEWGTYGEWVAADKEQRPNATYVSGFNWILTLQQAAEMAEAAGDTHHSALYRKNASRISRDFINTYYDHSSHTFGRGGQTELSLALRLNLLDSKETMRVGARLAERLENDGGAWGVGMFGFKYILQSLVKTKHAGAAFDLLMNMSDPSPGFMLSNDLEPATTNLWEIWDAIDQGGNMDSRNHHMYSTIATFLFELAGVEGNQEPGLGYSQKTPLRLVVGGVSTNISSACSKTKTGRGPFEFCWEVKKEGMMTEKQQRLSAASSSSSSSALTSFNVALSLGIYSNVTVPLVGRSSLFTRKGVHVKIEESGKEIFEGTLHRHTAELSHKPVAGLHRLAYDPQSNSLEFLLSSGKFDFQVLAGTVS
eukprot:jgi/Bigna1/72497/fgenesh1_pg.20_\